MEVIRAPGEPPKISYSKKKSPFFINHNISKDNFWILAAPYSYMKSIQWAFVPKNNGHAIHMHISNNIWLWVAFRGTLVETMNYLNYIIWFQKVFNDVYDKPTWDKLADYSWGKSA